MSCLANEAKLWVRKVSRLNIALSQSSQMSFITLWYRSGSSDFSGDVLYNARISCLPPPPPSAKISPLRFNASYELWWRKATTCAARARSATSTASLLRRPCCLLQVQCSGPLVQSGVRWSARPPASFPPRQWNVELLTRILSRVQINPFHGRYADAWKGFIEVGGEGGLPLWWACTNKAQGESSTNRMRQSSLRFLPYTAARPPVAVVDLPRHWNLGNPGSSGNCLGEVGSCWSTQCCSPQSQMCVYGIFWQICESVARTI